MPIRYKVIKKKSRMSAIVNGNSKYALKYEPGVTVMAAKGTLGIMVFTTKKLANEFAANLNNRNYYPSFYSDAHKRYIVIDVITHGTRGTYPAQISYHYSTQGLSDFYRDIDEHAKYMSTSQPPEGTMAYPGVTPLE